MWGSNPEALARAVAQCRRRLATWSRPSDILEVQARLGEIAKALGRIARDRGPELRATSLA